MTQTQKTGAVTVRLNSFRRHRTTRSHKGTDSWVFSPGNMQFLRQAEWALEEVATMNGTDTLVPTHVRAAEVGDRKIYLWSVPKSDPLGIELKRIGRNLWANLGPFLEEGNLTLPINTKERFRLVIVPESETPPMVPNALCLDLNNPIEVKPINKKKKKEEQQKQQQQKPEQKQKETSPAKESAAADQA